MSLDSIRVISRNQGKPLYLSLSFQVAVGLPLGSMLGLLLPDLGAAQLNPLVSGFVKLIKMVAGLIVFLTIGYRPCVAQAWMRARATRRQGTPTSGGSTVALILGLILSYVFQPGTGLA